MIESGETDALVVTKSKERLVHLFHRQFSLPLIGNEQAMVNCGKVLERLFNESDNVLIKAESLGKKYADSMALRTSRLVFEEKLMSEVNDMFTMDDKLRRWKEYIEFEIQSKQLSRAQRLYERAVIDMPMCTELWIAFCTFGFSTLKNMGLVDQVTTRAVKVDHSNTALWRMRFLAAESAAAAAASRAYATAAVPTMSDSSWICDAVQVAFTRGFLGAGDYLDVLFSASDFVARRIWTIIEGQPVTFGHPSVPLMSAQQTEGIRGLILKEYRNISSLFNLAKTFLSSYYPDWVMGWHRLWTRQSNFEHLYAKRRKNLFSGTTSSIDSSSYGSSDYGSSTSTSHQRRIVKSDGSRLRGSEVWEEAVEKFPTSYFVWKEYISWLKSIGEFDCCRKIFQKLTRFKLDSEVRALDMYNEWLEFEQQLWFEPASDRIRHDNSDGAVVSLNMNAVGAEISANAAQNIAHALRKGLPELLSAQSAAKEAAIAAASVLPSTSTTDATHLHLSSNMAESGVSLASAAVNLLEDAHSNSDSKSRGNNSHSSLADTEETAFHDTKKRKRGPDNDTDTGAESSSQKASTSIYTSAPTTSGSGSSSSSNDNNYKGNQSIQQGVARRKRTVQARNIPFNATIAEIQSHFSNHGSSHSYVVTDCYFILSKNGASRGVANIEFETLEGARNAINLNDSLFLNRKMVVQSLVEAEAGTLKKKVADAATSSRKKNPTATAPAAAKIDPAVAGSNSKPFLTTVFVDKLKADMTSDDLVSIFKQCGPILKARVAVDKKTSKSKVSKYM